MISRITVVRQIAMTPRGKGRRGGLDWFLPSGGFGGGGGSWWGDLIGSALQQIPRWLGPEPGGFSDVPARLPQQLPVPSYPSPPVIGFPYPTPRDINPSTTRKNWWQVPAAGGRKARRMRCTNEKAMRRAIRRVKCFQKLVKRSHVFSTLTAHGPVSAHRRKCKCQS